MLFFLTLVLFAREKERNNHYLIRSIRSIRFSSSFGVFLSSFRCLQTKWETIEEGYSMASLIASNYFFLISIGFLKYVVPIEQRHGTHSALATTNIPKKAFPGNSYRSFLYKKNNSCVN